MKVKRGLFYTASHEWVDFMPDGMLDFLSIQQMNIHSFQEFQLLVMLSLFRHLPL